MDNDAKEFEIFKKSKGLEELINTLDKCYKTIYECVDEPNVQKLLSQLEKARVLIDEAENTYRKIWPKKEKTNDTK